LSNNYCYIFFDSIFKTFFGGNIMAQKYTVRLSLEERKMLFELINKGKANKEKLNRARILLKADCGEEGEFWKDEQIAQAFYVSRMTVDRTRKSLVEEGLEATLNRRNIGEQRQRIIQGNEEAHLVALVCGEAPAGHARWTLRLLADTMIKLEYVDTVSHETIRGILKKMNLSLGKEKSGVFPQEQIPILCAKWKRS
jgi:transposase